ncbi:MAG: hypothetical protein HRT61_15465 [Ekhidna sp.]|nr:hypothetical protein [Ekhidna sp.]
MEDSHVREIEMYEQANAYLDDHIAVWITVPIISNYKNKVHQLIPLMKQAMDGTEDTSKIHLGQAILHIKKQIADKMDILDDTLEAYAEDINDNELRKQAANHYSDYFSLAYDEFVPKVTSMIALLEAHVGDMYDYGLVQDQIDDVKLNLDEYQESLGKEITYNIAAKITKQNINELLEEARTFAEKLDRVMKRFKRSDFTFYNGYVASRTLVAY